MKKSKLISILISLLLVIGVMPYAPFTAFAMTQSDIFESIEEGYDITLENDIMLTKTIVIPSDADVLIDLKGKKLDRGLKSCVQDGSVIRIEKGGKLKIKDSTGYNAGIISRGCSFLGGGIVNYGTLVLEGGTLSDNLALNNGNGCGGAIYNAEGATASLKGGIIEYNRADVGAGVYNAEGATLNIQGAKYEISKGAVKYHIYDNVNIRKNDTKTVGAGIANYGTLNMKDAPVIDDNEEDDLYLPSTKVININGALIDQQGKKAKVGLKTDKSPGNSVTSGFETNNPENNISDFFFGDGEFMLSNTLVNDLVEAVLKNTTKSIVQVFKEGKLVLTKEFSNPKDAWDSAYTLAERSNGYNTTEITDNYGFFKNGKVFHFDYEKLLEAIKAYTFHEKCRVELTLGSDWEHDKQLSVREKTSMVIDLNGHYIKRTRNMKQIDNGGVFSVQKNAKLIIKDSKPNSKGYDGIRGGVITGGASENTGGAIDMGVDSIVDIEGGTIYECTTCSDGGAINMSKGTTLESYITGAGYAGRTLIMRNCRVWFCQTIDSTDRCFGGGLYIDNNTNVYLKNVTIQDCYSEDSGGGVYLSNDNTNLHMENVLLSGNTCRDHGGAICVKSTNKADFEPLGAYNCTFVGNKSEEHGGAVYIDGKGKGQPTHFSKCSFKNNLCGENGSAVYCNDDNVVIDGCTITENHANGKGAVYVDSYYDISVQGLMTIKDNTAGTSKCRNLVLQDGIATSAYLYSGGLVEGSHVGVSSTGGGQVMISKEMPYYQIQYLHADNGKIVYEHTKNVESKLVTASLFSDGSVSIIIALVTLSAAAVAASIVIKKRRGGADYDDENEEE